MKNWVSISVGRVNLSVVRTMSKYIYLYLFILIVLYLLFFSSLITPSAFALTSTITTSSDYASGYYSSTESDSTQGSLKLKAAGAWSQTSVRMHDQALTSGTAVTSDDTYVYVLANSKVHFSRYLALEGKWEQLANAPHSALYGADMQIVGNYIYAIFGGYQKSFSRYYIPTDTWENLDDLPDYIHYGASLTTDGTDVFILRGTNTTDFWKYDVSETQFLTLTSAPATMYIGAHIIYHEGYIYSPRGNNQYTFYRYDVAGNTWSAMTASPERYYDDHNIIVRNDHIYINQGYNTSNFYRYDINDNNWDTLETTPQTNRYVGLAYTSGDDTMYFFRGNGQRDIWTFDPDADANGEFEQLAYFPSTFSTGADLVHYSGYLYTPRGTSTNMYRYSISGDAWETMTSQLGTIAYDNKGTVAGSYIYWFQGNNNTVFYRYTPDGVWTEMAVAPGTVRYGGALAYTGSGDYIYALRGQNTDDFWQYSISRNEWNVDSGGSPLDPVDLPSNSRAYIGARLATDGTYVYAITSGSGDRSLLRYDISGDSWSKLSDLPFSPYYGTDMVYYNSKLYLQAGAYKREVWEYTISGSTWRRLQDLQGIYNQDIGPWAGGSLESDGSGNLYSIVGSNAPQIQIMSLSSDNYVSSGTWTSTSIDLTYVDSFTSLSATEVTPGTSSISYETRTSVDGVNWSSWQSVTAGSIASPARRYIQVRTTLSADASNVDTPILQDFTITYVGDESMPTNPASFAGSSQQVGGVTLTNGGTYGHVHPYFSWNAGTDSETSVVGYYVYFGTSNTADPETAGSYQTSRGYVVTASMENTTYYLRIKTKDASGNISSAVAGFTYVYQGVQTQTITIDDEGEFEPTSVTNVSTASGQIKLDSKAGFWLEENVSVPPAGLGYGAGFVYDSENEMFYTARGQNTTTFYSYNPSTDVWTTLDALDVTVHVGGFVVEGPLGYLYAAAGNARNNWMRYDIEQNDWDDSVASNPPNTIHYGGAGVYDGSQYIYVLRGYNDDSFYRYDTQSDTWDGMANTEFEVSNTVYYGGDLAYDGTDTIYAIQGNVRDGFSSYSISGDTWSTLPALPHVAYLGASIEYDSTSNSIYFMPGYQTPNFYKFDLNTQTWSQLTDLPYRTYYGGDFKNVDGVLWTVRGEASQNIYKYNIAKSSWLTPTRGLFGTVFEGYDYFNMYYGADIEKGAGSTYYVLRGNYYSEFASYDAATGTITKLRDIPAGPYTGSDMAYDSVNSKVYASASGNNTNLYVYDVSTDTWDTVDTDPLPTVPGTGSSMVYDGARYIYWARGAGTSTFYRYDTQGSPGSRWGSTLALTYASLNYGSDLIYKDGYVYTLRGSNVNPNPLYKYDPVGNSWTSLGTIAIDVYNDAFLVDGGGDYLYACKAENTDLCYRYSITGDTWTSIADFPGLVYVGAAGAGDGTDRMYVIAGGASYAYQDAIYTYIMQTDDSSFETSGEYISQIHDLSSTYKYASIDVDYTSASNTTLTVSTRSSSDGETWDSWTAASELKSVGTAYTYEIKSAISRYIQVKFAMTSGDGIYSGLIDGYTINYYQDTDAPTNPTSIIGYSTATKSATLTSSNWYNYAGPTFDWPEAEVEGGASDTLTGSQVAGYYVYFGTDPDAVASVSGELITATEYTASNLTSGQTYYFNMITIDDAGNFADSQTSNFIYKYDSTAPTNPTTITADPSGYTATNSFTFNWSGATDSASLVSQYCYKTGESGSTDTCISDTTLSGALAYRTGTNTLYIRTKDTAGNYSAEYTSVTFYYSATAPGAVVDLRVTYPTDTTSNSLNDFAFAWDPPESYYGQQSGLRYYYVFNSLPTGYNVNEIGLSVTYLSRSTYATQKGVNTLYVVAKDEAGNVDYNIYSSVEFTADTTAPGIPRNLDISDVSIKETSSWRLALSWDEPTATGSGVSTYKVYRSAVEDSDCTTNVADFNNIASTSQTSYVDTGLTQTTKYYCIKACDSTNECSAVSDTVHLYPDGRWRVAPTLVASPSATVKTKSAKITWSTSRTANSFVQYGKSSGTYGEETGSSTQVSSHSVDLTGLDPGTTYYYKVLWTDEDGNTGTSDEMTLTTNPAPIVSNVQFSDLSLYSVYVTFTVANATAVSIQYGETLSYGGVVSLSTSLSETTHSVKIESLTDDTEYHLRILAEDDELNQYYSDDYIFSTLPQPKIVASKIQQVVGMPTATIRLAWTTNTSVTSVVTYFPTANPERAKDKISIALKTSHEMLIDQLQDEKEYTFLVKGKDLVGNDIATVTYTLKTAADLRAPEIIDLTVESTIVGVGEEARAQIIVCWDTDEPASTQVEYGQGSGNNYDSTTQEDTNLSVNHCVTIPGLIHSRIYHLRAVSKDKAGNIGNSFDTVIVTPKATRDALALVMERLSKTFGFIKNLNFNR